jgi:hypothetical protein
VPKTKQAGFDFIDALPNDGERKLMLAVLIDAIRTLSQQFGAARGAHRHAWLQDQAWVSSEDHLTPFSFINICSALGLNAGYVRRLIRHLQRGKDTFRVHRYAAKVEESWERQRSGLSRPPSINGARTARARAKRVWAQVPPPLRVPVMLLDGTHASHP